MTYGTHLRRSRHGTLYFRFVVPPDVRAIVERSELSISLGTASKRDAELVALELQLKAKRLVETARDAIRMSEPEKPNRKALHARVRELRYNHLLTELHEADGIIAAKSAQVDKLTAKLIARFDAPLAVAVPTAADPTLSAAIEAFKAERAATGAWRDKTAKMWDSRLRLLVDWFGDVPVSGLSREAMTGFLNALKKLPKNASKYTALSGLGMRELIEAEGVARIAPATCNQVMECVSAFFAWMDTDRAKWRVSGNVAKGLTLSNVEGVKRVAFSAEDLRAMFTSPEWKARKFLYSYPSEPAKEQAAGSIVRDRAAENSPWD